MKINDDREKILKEKDDLMYNYLHSKPPVKYNPWKFSNRIIKEFSRCPSDKVHSFAKDKLPKPNYLAEPFRRPKIYGDYFAKNVYT